MAGPAAGATGKRRPGQRKGSAYILRNEHEDGGSQDNSEDPSFLPSVCICIWGDPISSSAQKVGSQLLWLRPMGFRRGRYRHSESI